MEATAKEKLKRSEFLAKLSPTLAKNLGAAAEGIYKYVDIQKGVNKFKEIQAANGFDKLDKLNEEMEKQTNFKELQNNVTKLYMILLMRIFRYCGLPWKFI